MAARFAVTITPVLAGFDPEDTLTVSNVLSPAATEAGDADPAPVGGSGSAQEFSGEELLRGEGAAAAKSAALLSVSVQPPDFRIAAVVLLSVGAAALSKKF